MGRKSLASVAQLYAGEGGTKVLRFLADVMDGAVHGAKARDRIQAAALILDRAYGKAVDFQVHARLGEGPDGGSPLAQIATEALLALASPPDLGHALASGPVIDADPTQAGAPKEHDRVSPREDGTATE